MLYERDVNMLFQSIYFEIRKYDTYRTGNNAG